MIKLESYITSKWRIEILKFSTFCPWRRGTTNQQAWHGFWPKKIPAFHQNLKTSPSFYIEMLKRPFHDPQRVARCRTTVGVGIFPKQPSPLNSSLNFRVFFGTIEVDPKISSHRFSQWVGGDFAGVLFYFLSPSQWVVMPGRFRLVSFVQLMQDERGRSPLHLAAAQGHQPAT